MARTPGEAERTTAPEHAAAAPAPAVPARAGQGVLATAGNRAVTRLLEQTSQPSDPDERVAARAAAAATAQPAAAPGPPAGGLDPVVRTAMAGLLHDTFDDVTLHTGAAAHRFAVAAGADAVTRGSDVYFAAGRYRPDTAAGARLLAHELVHTRQPESPVLRRDGGATTLTYVVEAAEPEVFLFAGTGTAQQIAATLYGDPGRADAVRFVPTPPAKKVDGVVAQGARPTQPAALTPDATTSLRWALDTALTADVERTVGILSEASIGAGDEAALTELSLRWSQRSDVTTAGGGSYFDAYLDALNRRTLTQPHWYTAGLSETSRTALQWLLIETEGSAEQIRKAIELRSATWTTGYTVTDRRPELRTGDMVGRFYGSDGSTNPVRVLETIGSDAAQEATARLVQRRVVGAASSDGLGAGVVVPDPDGGFTGYLVDFALLDAFVPHPFQDEGGHYYWYYPGTVMVSGHQLWDAATRAQFQGDVRAQSADRQADLIGFEGAAVRIRSSAGLLSPPLLAAWQQADRAMIEVSGSLAAGRPVDAAATGAALRAFFGLAREEVEHLDAWKTIYYDSMDDSVNARETYLSNPYFDVEAHTAVLARLGTAVTPQGWRAVLADYHRVTAGMDDLLAKRLRDTGGAAGAEQAAQLEYAGAAARALDTLTLEHPEGRRIRAVFYPLDTVTAADEGLGPVVAQGMTCLFYVHREGDVWHLTDLTTPRREKATSRAGGTADTPPQELFTALNTKLRFPLGRLYWELPDGAIYVMPTTEPTSLGQWLKTLGMTLGIAAMAVGTLGAGLPATLLVVGASLTGAAGTVAELSEKSQAGVLTDTDVVVGVVDVITGLAQAGSAVTGRIVRSAALTGGTASRLATTVDAHVYRQLVGVSLFGQSLSFVITTQAILDEYYRAKAAADATGSDLALRRLVMHLFMSGGMLLMGARSDVAALTGGRTLRLGPADAAGPGRPAAEVAARHDEWVAEMAALGVRGRPGPRSGPALEPGLVGVYDDPQLAYRAYDATLNRPGEAEVGVFRNDRGDYVVMIGRATAVDPPGTGGPWHAVVHYHSNPGHALTARMPAAADVDGALAQARTAGRPVTEFVESPLPGGGRTVTAYTAAPDGTVTVEYVRPGGERVRQSFADLDAYRAELASRDVMLDPSSPHFREMMADLDALYRGRPQAVPGGRTAAGPGWEGRLDAVGGEAVRTELTTAFASQPGRLEALVGELDAVEVLRLRERLGSAGLARAAARASGATIRYLSADLTPAEVDALVAATDPVHLAWAARGRTGTQARELLTLPPDVLTALSDPVGGLPAPLVRQLTHGPAALPTHRLRAVLAAVQPGDLPYLRQQFGDEGFLQVVRTEDRPENLRDMAVRLRAGAAELAPAAPLPSGAEVLDANTLIPLQQLRAGAPWRGVPAAGNPLHDGDRLRITLLAGRHRVTFTGPGGAPTPAEIELLMARIGNRVPSAVLAETQAVAGFSRGQALDVDRNAPEYRLALREMEAGHRGPAALGAAAPPAAPAGREHAGGPVGDTEGGADRIAIADLLFATRAPGAAPPVFYTADARVVEPLLVGWGVPGSWNAITPQPARGQRGGWLERFAAANRTGFLVEVRGRIIRVVVLR